MSTTADHESPINYLRLSHHNFDHYDIFTAYTLAHFVGLHLEEMFKISKLH